MTRADRLSLAWLLAHPEELRRTARRVLDGQVFVYPTETIYGLGGRADSDQVRNRVLAAKQRPPENPLILLASARSAFDPLGILFPPAAERLAQAFWPGKLTLVLPQAASGEMIGVRVSDHPFLTALGEVVDVPLFSTSANLSGEPYDPAPGRIFTLFAGCVDFMVDAGDLPKSLPSTVARVTREGEVEVLREGVVSGEQVREAL